MKDNMNYSIFKVIIGPTNVHHFTGNINIEIGIDINSDVAFKLLDISWFNN